MGTLFSRTASTSTMDRLKGNDPSLTKLELVKPPSHYYVNLGKFVSALRTNTTIDHVLVGSGYLRHIKDDTELLHAVTSIQNLLELEFQGADVPLASVCRAVANHRTIQKLHIEGGRLYELSDCSVLAEHPSLKSFRLKNFRFNPDDPRGLDTLLTALSTCPALESVVMTDGYIRKDALASANGLGALAKSPSLKSLVLRNLKLTSADLLVFSHNLLRQRLSTLKVLDLKNNRLKDLTALNQAVSEHQSLKTLCLSRNRLTAPSCVGLVNAITSNRLSSLEKLSLNHNRMGDGVAESLALLLRTTRLKYLELADNNLTDRTFFPMAQALETNTVLERLYLRRNRISDESHVALASALTRNRTFNRIDLESDRGSLTVVVAWAELNMLGSDYVIDNIITGLASIGTGEIPHIGNQAVSEHQSLKTLSLSCSNLTSTRWVGLVTAFARNEWSTLEKLSLNNNKIGDGAVDSLALLLRRTTSLKYLELGCNDLTDRGLVPLAQSLETNRLLEKLTLFSNTMSDESYVAFASALTNNRTLKLIDLNAEHRLLTVVGAKALLEMVKNNFVIETIRTGVSSNGTGELPLIVNQIGIFLILNRAGRRRLLVGQASRQDWLDVIAKLGDDLDAVRYLVRANPLLFARHGSDNATASVRKRKAEPEVDSFVRTTRNRRISCVVSQLEA